VGVRVVTHALPDLAPDGGWTDAARVADIARLRASIDNFDSALVHLLAERFKLTGQVGRHKAALGWPTSTRDREEQQITRLRALASANGLDPDVEERFLAFLIGEVLVKHGEERRPRTAAAPTSLKVAIPTLETERLWLRAFRESDFPPYAAFYALPESQYVGGPMSPDLVWRRMAAYVGHWAWRGYGPFALECKASGAFVGYAGPWFPEGKPEPEIAYSLMPDQRGRGFATEAVKRSLAFAYDEIGLTTAVSYIDPTNIPSCRLAERVGARPDGTHAFGPWLLTVYRHAAPAHPTRTL
jgi:monofunctional chorismate mutase